MAKMQVSEEIRALIRDACEDYKIEFKKHRKEVTHYSKGGIYQEHETYRFEYR